MQPVVITYQSPQLAQLALNRLQQHDLRATLDGDELSTNLSAFGGASGKVQLSIHPEDYVSAEPLLQELELTIHETSEWDENPEEWICDTCEEQNLLTFDVCWNCQADRPASPTLVPADPEQNTTIEVINEHRITTSDTSNFDTSDPYASPTVSAVVVRRVKNRLGDRKGLYRTVVIAALLPYFFVVAIAIGVYHFFHRPK